MNSKMSSEPVEKAKSKKVNRFMFYAWLWLLGAGTCFFLLKGVSYYYFGSNPSVFEQALFYTLCIASAVGLFYLISWLTEPVAQTYEYTDTVSDYMHFFITAYEKPLDVHWKFVPEPGSEVDVPMSDSKEARRSQSAESKAKVVTEPKRDWTDSMNGYLYRVLNRMDYKLVLSFSSEDVRFALSFFVRLYDSNAKHIRIFTDYVFCDMSYQDIAVKRSVLAAKCERVVDQYSEWIKHGAPVLLDILKHGLIPEIAGRLSDFMSNNAQAQNSASLAEPESSAEEVFTEDTLVRLFSSPPKGLDTPFSEVHLSNRLRNCLIRSDLSPTPETPLRELLSMPANYYRTVRSLGQTTFTELVDTFYQYGATEEEMSKFLGGRKVDEFFEGTEPEEFEENEDGSSSSLDIEIREAGLSVGLYNCLTRAGFEETTTLRELMERPYEDYLLIRNLGRVRRDELISAFERFGASEQQISRFKTMNR